MSQKKVDFTALGGAQEVGRSSFILNSGEQIVLDRGVKLSPSGIEYPEAVSAHVDAMVISHAHLDHSGHVPAYFLDGNTKLYLTPPTLELAKILWYDTLKIADSEGLEPAFTEQEIRSAEQHSFPTPYKRKVNITPTIEMELFDAGHIPGSALCKFTYPNTTIMYTGDYKVIETRLQKGADLKVGKVDTVILESTYGDREQPDRNKSEKAFVEKVHEVLEDGGTVVVPAFAVGRGQEIIDILVENKVTHPIYLDGMGQKAARVMLDNPDYIKNPAAFKRAMSTAQWVKNNRNVRKAALKQPSVIVTSAGMLQGGPALHYIGQKYDDKKSAILMTGYQVEETPGHHLLETGKIPIDGKVLDVKMHVERFDFSAHPSQSELLTSLKKWSPENALLVHGDKKALPEFKKTIESELGINAIIPSIGKKISL